MKAGKPLRGLSPLKLNLLVIKESPPPTYCVCVCGWVCSGESTHGYVCRGHGDNVGVILQKWSIFLSEIRSLAHSELLEAARLAAQAPKGSRILLSLPRQH